MKVISGGQTGADQGGLLAARDLGIETGGWAVKGWRTEIGVAPWLGEWGLREMRSKGYRERTRANVEMGDGTVIFGKKSAGSLLTYKYATSIFRPVLWLTRGEIERGEGNIHAYSKAFEFMRKWLGANGVECLNVAGNRESVSPGIQESVRVFMREVLEWYVT